MAEPLPMSTGLLPDNDAGIGVLAKFFGGLGDVTRLRLLEFVLPAEHSVSECVAHVGLSQGRVSTHLRCLADCGYVQVRRAGRHAYYRVADPRVAQLVRLAQSLAARNGGALATCLSLDEASAAEGHSPRSLPG